MRRELILILSITALAGCSTLNWPPERGEDDLTAQELREADCRLARPSDPAGRGEWVCENPRTGEIERQSQNPVFGHGQRRN
ncbi:MAG: hypothetical protein COW29_08025 [Rhodobacterales bacterium CG15_BIG_FIL_POST_REV_8_21_14_020_59_13]|nr:MAG: hypothetical protein COW29_08025 [Rhodobacterales bacterium CG15_BIG_FIL_POST_REV_8_21_14_020_59_13]